MSSAMFAHEIKFAQAPAPGTRRSSLRVNHPGDAFEREADRAADAVMGAHESKLQWSLSHMPIGASVQRKCACGGSADSEGECEECAKKKAVQRKETGPIEDSEAPPLVHQVLKASGKPLERTTREFFEQRFGYDFGRVRVHTDDAATESARLIHAAAYTADQQVVFGSGRYAPQTPAGARLLAHELAHTVQQSRSARAAGMIQRQSTETEESKGPTGLLGKAKYLLKDVGNVVSPEKWKQARGCLTSLFPSMRSLTFDDWIPKACARSTTKILHNREWDAFGHCWIACEGTRKCGGPQTFGYGMGREVSREWESRHGGPPHDSLTQDISNQIIGRAASVKEGTCFSICDELHKSRLLNLTAPEATCVDCANQGAGEGPCPGAAKTAGAP